MEHIGMDMGQKNVTGSSEYTSGNMEDGHHMMMMDGHMVPADNSISMMMMQMTFYAGVDATVLINQWKTSNAGELFGTALFWFIVAILHQGTKRLRRSLAKRYKGRLSRQGSDFTKLTEDGTGQSAISPQAVVTEMPTSALRIRLHIIQSLLQLIQTTTSFILMLVFMTYNIWLALAIVLGDMGGYLIFSFDLDYDTEESCCG